MSWLDSLQRVVHPDGRRMVGASFRGVAFYVEETEYQGGRRLIPHEFPGRDDPYIEDQGRRARVFPVEGYVLGDDYIAQRNKLLDALELKGPGELIHPYHGRRVVAVGQFRITETVREGRTARFSIEFHEAPLQVAIALDALDPAVEVDTDADLALDATRAEFASAFDVVGLPGHAITSASDALSDMAAGTEAALAPVTTITQELAAMSAEMQILQLEAVELVRAPSEIVVRFEAALATVQNTALGAPLAVSQAFATAYLTELDIEPFGFTPTKEREIANRRAIERALRRVLVIEAARLAALGDYETLEYAIATRDQLADLLEEQAALADDAAYHALTKLRSSLIRAVPGDAVLARIVTISRPVPVPSLVLAYQLYGSVDSEPDIVARNRPSHPGFMSGDLQVLSDDE